MEVIPHRIQIVAGIGIDHLFEQDPLPGQGLGEEPGLGDVDCPVLQAVHQHQRVVGDTPSGPKQDNT